MARQERPLNPAEGPLQAFAHDLRLLRAQAGNPTYRALARSAGYSATTLSQAAGGMRKPTLEVAVAYVGACGGDVEAWRRRWWELGDTPNESTTPAPAPATPNPSASTAPPSPPEPAVNPVRVEVGSWSRGQRIGVVIAALATIAGSTAASVLAVSAANRDQSTVTSHAQVSAQERGCPPLSPSAVFTGETYGFGARVYRGASREEPILRTIPTGCLIGLVGHCLGEAMKDATSGTPDVRWFVLDSGASCPRVSSTEPSSDCRCPDLTSRPCPHDRSEWVGPRTPCPAVDGDRGAWTSSGSRCGDPALRSCTSGGRSDDFGGCLRVHRHLGSPPDATPDAKDSVLLVPPPVGRSGDRRCRVRDAGRVSPGPGRGNRPGRGDRAVAAAPPACTAQQLTPGPEPQRVPAPHPNTRTRTQFGWAPPARSTRRVAEPNQVSRGAFREVRRRSAFRRSSPTTPIMPPRRCTCAGRSRRPAPRTGEVTGRRSGVPETRASMYIRAPGLFRTVTTQFFPVDAL